jgi:NADH-quinone oxidoreductase subunit N
MSDPQAISPFIPAWNTVGFALRPFVGELILIITIVLVLLAPFFTPKRSNVPCALIALLGLVAAFVSLFAVHAGDISGEQFSGMLVSDSLAVYFKGILYLFAAGIVLMWFSATSVFMHEGDAAEFFVLLLGATLGMSLMASTSNLLMIFLTFELASLPSYVLAGFHKTQRLGAEASLKYVLFGSACSAIMIFGLSYLYGLTGSLQFSHIATQIALGGANTVIITVALICVLVGIGFKIALVPLHFWCPDVFEGAGVDVAAFLSVASKGAALILLTRLMVLMGPNLPAEASKPQGVGVLIGVLGALTATVANAAALGQTSVKRLLAYSSIAHAGYMLCVLPLVLAPEPARDSAIQALLIYLTVYLFMNLGAFTVAGLLERHDGSTNIADYAGLGRRAPLMAICMTLFLFSLIGLPPLAGFIAKLNIMWLLGAAGSGWWILVAVIAINTLLSVYYYARIIKAMYFVPSKTEKLFSNSLGLAIVAICAIMLIAMLIFFGTFSHLASNCAPQS